MKFSVLASGSTGNVTYIESGHTKILIDAGMTCLYIEKKLKEMDINPAEINAIVITHTHVDHIGGLRVFIKKYNPQIFITEKMYPDLAEILVEKNYTIFEDTFFINDLKIQPFRVSHDAPDTVGYIVESQDNAVVYVTDTGYLNNKHFEILRNKNAYVFESNHDVKMLMDGKYQYHLKQRILSDRGHLSNKDSAYYLSKIIGSNTKHIILAHLSKENNTPELAIDTFNQMINKTDFDLTAIVASPNERTDLIEV